MELIRKILQTLPDGEVIDVRLGLHWTAVALDFGEGVRCGLSATLSQAHDHVSGPDVPQAGALTKLTGSALAELALSDHPVQIGIGMAAINALMPPLPEKWREDNAEEMIARLGAGKKVVLIGHFPFVESLRGRVGELTVLELHPRPGDLPAEQAPRVIPQADVVAVTGMTLLNRTLDGILKLRAPEAVALMLGPSTPLSPLLFEAGFDVLSGAIVAQVDAVLRVVSQGGNFRQAHRAGVRLVNLLRQDFEDIAPSIIPKRGDPI